MPELPEVETIRRDLAAVVSDQKIKTVKITSPKTAFPSAVFLTRRLVGRRIVKIERRGKLLIFNLAKAPGSEFNHLLIHLKMTGQLIYLDAETEVAGGHGSLVRETLPNKHTRAIIEFQKGGHLFFNDLRRFGYLKLVTTDELKRLSVENYGPEPLTPEFSLSVFRTILGKRKTKIKALLLNQKLIAGLGNIYVDEALWEARLRPERTAASLSVAERKKLYQAINRIIKKAIKQRGTTFNSYVDSKGRRGNFSRFLKVYGRRGEKCPRCRRPIIRKKIFGRGTHYCPYCQV